MVYARPPGSPLKDYKGAREFENMVANALGDQVVCRFESTSDVDIWVPGAYIDVKEKNQRYSANTFLKHLEGTSLADVDERDIFIIDELSVRRCLEKSPTSSFFVMRDRPEDRLFAINVMALTMTDHVRVDREYESKRRKGKWLCNLQDWVRVSGLENIAELIFATQTSQPWRRSECMAEAPKE